MNLVLDASVALDWFLPSEVGQAYSAQLLKTAAKGGVEFHVPLHFDVEVVGQLVKHHRRTPDTYTAAWLKQSLVTLDLLPIKTHALGINFKALGDLSMAYQLSAYDTPYFHLARMLGIGIASRDRGILAGGSWGVEVWQPG